MKDHVYGSLQGDSRAVSRVAKKEMKAILQSSEYDVLVTMLATGKVEVTVSLREAPYPKIARWIWKPLEDMVPVEGRVYRPLQHDLRHYWSTIDQTYVLQIYRGDEWKPLLVDGNEYAIAEKQEGYHDYFHDYERGITYYRKLTPGYSAEENDIRIACDGYVCVYHLGRWVEASSADTHVKKTHVLCYQIDDPIYWVMYWRKKP